MYIFYKLKSIWFLIMTRIIELKIIAYNNYTIIGNMFLLFPFI